MKKRKSHRIVWRSSKGEALPRQVHKDYYTTYDDARTRKEREYSADNALMGMFFQLQRLQKNMTQEEFAKYVGLPVVVIEDVEAGHPGIHIGPYLVITNKLKLVLWKVMKQLFETRHPL